MDLAYAYSAAAVAAVIAAAWALGRARRYAISRASPVVSRVDGMPYRVHAAHGGRRKAADTLAEINRRIIEVLRHLRARYGRSSGAAAAVTARLLVRYDPDSLAENSPRDPAGDTSYTIDKGALVALCLRERDPRATGDPAEYDIHDIDTITFVALHELAHIAVEAVDHPPAFWEAFRFLLEEAEAAGVYTSPDFAVAPRVYCGLTIDYNPRYDPEIGALARRQG